MCRGEGRGGASSGCEKGKRIASVKIGEARHSKCVCGGGG